jgi:hypothetical protein
MEVLMAGQNTVSSGSFQTSDTQWITDEVIFAFPTTLTFDLNITETLSFLEVFVFVIDPEGTNPGGKIRVDGPGVFSQELDPQGGKYHVRIESGGGQVAGTCKITSTIPVAIPP